MADTPATIYSRIVEGKLTSRGRLIQKLDSGFDVDFGAQAGAITVQMFDTATTATPAVGTPTTNKNNTQEHVLTLTSTETTLAKLPHEIQASYGRPEAMRAYSTQAADALLTVVQNQLIATLKAASVGSSQNLGTGYINFAVPSADTIPDMLAQLGKLQYGLDFVRDNSNLNDEDIVIIGTTRILSNLRTLSQRAEFDKIVTREGSLRYFDGVECFGVNTGTDFGGASQEALFVVGKRGVGVKCGKPYVQGGGWLPGDDGAMRWMTLLPYAYGTAELEFVAELVNPSS